jgi:hypothetical protein
MGSDHPKRKLGAKRPVPVGSFMMRRVFRQENRYYCGICRTFHDSVEAANRCLESCWKAVLTRAPWTTVKRVGKIAFACIYCQRTFPTAQQATTCAEECASRMTITSLDGRDLSPDKIKHVFHKQNTKPTVNFPFKIGGQHPVQEVVPEPQATSINQVAAPQISLDAATAKATKTATAKDAATQNTPAKSAQPEPPPPDKTPVDPSKKFEREGAKYVCIVCHKKFFERVAAEKCFDGHAGGSAASQPKGPESKA